jgi:two-component system cell cycle sensor histidine kinase/response regulator CckA
VTEGTPRDPVTILVAEDEEATLHLVATTLRTEGYTVLEALDGRAAEAMAAKYRVPPDLLLTDFVMPDMNGHELAERLRPRYPGMKVLLTSAHIAEEIVQEAVLEEAFRRGAAFLQKPFTPDELLRKVRAVLAGAAG